MISRRIATFFLASFLLLAATFYILSPESPASRLKSEQDFGAAIVDAQVNHVGQVVMPKMVNATAKAELGRAGWKLLHTMAQRYPEMPTEDQKQTFKSFLYLFSRMYPCGECAEHFQSMLKEYPPQTANRNTASLYLCMLHNKVNARLEKEEFDCSKLEGLYDCGCGDEPTDGQVQAQSQAQAQDQLAVGTLEEGEDSTYIDPLTGEELIPG